MYLKLAYRKWLFACLVVIVLAFSQLVGSGLILSSHHTAVKAQAPDSWVTLDDNDPLLQYAYGSWTRVNVPPADGGTLTYTVDAGATMTISFEGTGIQVVYSQGPEGGAFDGQLFDAGFDELVLQQGDGYAAEYRYGQTLTYDNLPEGFYALNLTNGQGALWIEAIRIQQSIQPTPSLVPIPSATEITEALAVTPAPAPAFAPPVAGPLSSVTDAEGWLTYPDTHPTFRYGDGMWQIISDPASLSGSVTFTSTVAASVRIPFEGTAIRVIYVSGPDGGEFAAVVDEKGTAQTVKGYSDTTTYGNALTFEGLSDGMHMLTLVNGDGAVRIEAVQVRGTMTPIITPPDPQKEEINDLELPFADNGNQPIQALDEPTGQNPIACVEVLSAESGNPYWWQTPGGSLSWGYTPAVGTWTYGSTITAVESGHDQYNGYMTELGILIHLQSNTPGTWAGTVLNARATIQHLNSYNSGSPERYLRFKSRGWDGSQWVDGGGWMGGWEFDHSLTSGVGMSTFHEWVLLQYQYYTIGSYMNFQLSNLQLEIYTGTQWQYMSYNMAGGQSADTCGAATWTPSPTSTETPTPTATLTETPTSTPDVCAIQEGEGLQAGFQGESDEPTLEPTEICYMPSPTPSPEPSCIVEVVESTVTVYNNPVSARTERIAEFVHDVGDAGDMLHEAGYVIDPKYVAGNELILDGRYDDPTDGQAVIVEKDVVRVKSFRNSGSDTWVDYTAKPWIYAGENMERLEIVSGDCPSLAAQEPDPLDPRHELIEQLRQYRIEPQDYGLTFKGGSSMVAREWTLGELQILKDAVTNTSDALNEVLPSSNDSREAFIRVMVGSLPAKDSYLIVARSDNTSVSPGCPVVMQNNEPVLGDACTDNNITSILIRGDLSWRPTGFSKYLLVHEFGHRLDHRMQAVKGQGLAADIQAGRIGDCEISPQRPNGFLVMGRTTEGAFKRGAEGWGSSSVVDDEVIVSLYQQNPEASHNETGADMFLNWVYRRPSDAPPVGDPCNYPIGDDDWEGFRNYDISEADAPFLPGNTRYWWMDHELVQIFSGGW